MHDEPPTPSPSPYILEHPSEGDHPLAVNQQVFMTARDSAASRDLDEKVSKPVSPKPRCSQRSIKLAPLVSTKAAPRVLVVDGAALLSNRFCSTVNSMLRLPPSFFIVYSSDLDSASSLKLMTMLLRRLGIIADTAENGRIAVAMIIGAHEPYEIVFMDNLMPEMVPQIVLIVWIHFDCITYCTMLVEWSRSDDYSPPERLQCTHHRGNRKRVGGNDECSQFE